MVFLKNHTNSTGSFAEQINYITLTANAMKIPLNEMKGKLPSFELDIRDIKRAFCQKGRHVAELYDNGFAVSCTETGEKGDKYLMVVKGVSKKDILRFKTLLTVSNFNELSTIQQGWALRFIDVCRQKTAVAEL